MRHKSGKMAENGSFKSHLTKALADFRVFFFIALALNSGVFPPTCGGTVCYREASSTHDYYPVLLFFSKTAAVTVVILQRH